MSSRRIAGLRSPVLSGRAWQKRTPHRGERERGMRSKLRADGALCGPHFRRSAPCRGLVLRGPSAVANGKPRRASAGRDGLTAGLCMRPLTTRGGHPRSRPITGLPPSSTGVPTHCGREIAVKLANYRFSGGDRCAPVGGCANMSVRRDSELHRAENGLGEWLTTAIHDAKPLNACLSLAAATVRQNRALGRARGPALGRGLPAAASPRPAWRSSTWGRASR
jgi:hypothetical protein